MCSLIRNIKEMTVYGKKILSKIWHLPFGLIAEVYS